MSPLRWLLTRRLRRAQELLETSDLSVEQVASRTGMGTATTLRRHFSQRLGVPPETYRRTFRPESPAHTAARQHDSSLYVSSWPRVDHGLQSLRSGSSHSPSRIPRGEPRRRRRGCR